MKLIQCNSNTNGTIKYSYVQFWYITPNQYSKSNSNINFTKHLALETDPKRNFRFKGKITILIVVFKTEQFV